MRSVENGISVPEQSPYRLSARENRLCGGVGAPGLTDSYDAERRPVGEEVVGMTVRNAREGIDAGESSVEMAKRKQAQLLIS